MSSDARENRASAAVRSTNQDDVPDVPVASAGLDPSRRRLDELAALPNDWDSYGAVTPSGEWIQAARDLLLMLQAGRAPPLRRRVNPSHISPLPVGGVQLEWDGLRKDLEVEIGPDGRFAYLLVDRTGAERRYSEDDDVPATTVLDLVADVLRS